MVSKTLSRLTVIEKIYRSGMGEMYGAEDTTLRREVAITALLRFEHSILSMVLALFLTAVGLGQGAWRSLGPEGGGVSALIIDPVNPMTLYANSGAGVIKTTDGGVTWRVSNNGLSTGVGGTLAIAPADPMTVYAGGLGVFKTTDGGASWRAANNGLTARAVRTLAIDPVDPMTLYAGSANAKVFKSTDGGASWSTANNGLTATYLYTLAIEPADRMTLYAGTDAGVFKTTDGGVNWNAASNGVSSVVRAFAIDPTNYMTLYAATGRGVFKDNGRRRQLDCCQQRLDSDNSGRGDDY